MLNLTLNSRSSKTTGCHVTHRAGTGERFKTCPVSCSLNPTRRGSRKVDPEYLAALVRARPRNGVSMTYSHFDPSQWHGFDDINMSDDRTVINWSIDGADQLVEELPRIDRQKIPAAVVLSPGDKLPAAIAKRVVRCPAETRNISCGGGIDASGRITSPCGGGRPLCGRTYDDRRGIVIAFTAHGSGKRLAVDAETRGGCYANYWRVAKTWQKTADQETPAAADGEILKDWIELINRVYPRGGQIVRHHIAGDLGRD